MVFSAKGKEPAVPLVPPDGFGDRGETEIVNGTMLKTTKQNQKRIKLISR